MEKIVKKRRQKILFNFHRYREALGYADLYMDLLADLIAEMTRNSEEYRYWRRKIDFVALRKFCNSIMRNAKRIIEYIDWAERELN
ncbi:MAG: hypothetical protein DRN91_08775 [Candidatus Alkanophagales archaeon]|nr:MAG: hypothetical protein DRN91_08775 [Candidatus Alkanophagales archaeon]